MRSISALLALATLSSSPRPVMPTSDHAPCISVLVQGCGRKARVCVPGVDVDSARSRALKAFSRVHHCNAAQVIGWSQVCPETETERCDLKL